jgi:putative peptidoglycan lipid II flippase
LFSSVALVAGSGLVVAVLSFLTSSLIAAWFGANAASDRLFVLLTVALSIAPPLVSSLDAAFLEKYQDLTSVDRKQLAATLIAQVAIAFLVLGGLLWSTRSVWLSFFSVDAADGEAGPALAVATAVVLGWGWALQRTVLVAHRRFGVIALTNVCAPTGGLLLLWVGRDRLGLESVLVGLALGALVSLMFSAAASRMYLSRPDAEAIGTGFGVLAPAVPLAIGSVLFVLGMLAPRWAATGLGPGGISAQYFAERLFFLPHSLITVSASAVILPFVPRPYDSDHYLVAQIIVAACVVMAPLTALMLLFSPEIISVVFQRGAFSEADALQSAQALRGYSLALPLLFVVALVWRMLQLRKRMRTVLAAPFAFLVASALGSKLLLPWYGAFALGFGPALGGIAALGIALTQFRLAEVDRRYWTRAVVAIGSSLLVMGSAGLALASSDVLHPLTQGPALVAIMAISALSYGLALVGFVRTGFFSPHASHSNAGGR